MKTLQTLITSALFASVAIASTVQADNSLSNLIYEESSNIFSKVSTKNSAPHGIVSYSDDANKNSVWSAEYEQYVNPADFRQAEMAGLEGVNQYMDNNPTAAGSSASDVFIFNETAGEYQLQ